MEGRGMDKDAVESVATGGIYTAKQSLANGLIDDIGDYQTALDWFEARLGHEVTIVEQRRRAGLADLLFGMRADSAPSVAQLLTTSTGPRFLYFWQGGR
jgi:ClpP class serine protease